MDCLLAQAALVVTLSVRLLGIELAVERDGRIHDLIGPVTDLHQALQARDDFRFSFNQFRALARSRIHHLAEHRRGSRGVPHGCCGPLQCLRSRWSAT